MQHDLAETRRILETQDIDVVRLIFADLLGITRSKDVLVSQLERAAEHGPAFCQGTWVTTTRGGVLDAGSGTGSIEDGLPDMISKLDVDTIRPIPWLPGVAYAIADIDNPDGSRSTIAPRAVLRAVLDEYAKDDLLPVCGPELEFYLAQRTEDGWERILNKLGRVYTTGSMVDSPAITSSVPLSTRSTCGTARPWMLPIARSSSRQQSRM
jgi:glutamine synthetase